MNEQKTGNLIEAGSVSKAKVNMAKFVQLKLDQVKKANAAFEKLLEKTQ